jgi:hypothetical protein
LGTTLLLFQLNESSCVEYENRGTRLNSKWIQGLANNDLYDEFCVEPFEKLL